MGLSYPPLSQPAGCVKGKLERRCNKVRSKASATPYSCPTQQILLIHPVKEFSIALCRAQLVDEEFHGINRTHG